MNNEKNWTLVLYRLKIKCFYYFFISLMPDNQLQMYVLKIKKEMKRPELSGEHQTCILNFILYSWGLARNFEK